MTFLLDPDASLDFAFDWTDWLTDTETITDFTVTVDDTVTVSRTSQTGGVVTVWLSGGTVGSYVHVTCHITTDAGRIDDRTMTIRIVER